MIAPLVANQSYVPRAGRQVCHPGRTTGSMMPYVPLVGGDIWNTDSAGVPLSIWKAKIEALMAVVADHHVVFEQLELMFHTLYDSA